MIFLLLVWIVLVPSSERYPSKSFKIPIQNNNNNRESDSTTKEGKKIDQMKGLNIDIWINMHWLYLYIFSNNLFSLVPKR